MTRTRRWRRGLASTMVALLAGLHSVSLSPAPSLAAPSAIQQLAPGPAEFRAHAALASERVAIAEAIGRTVALLHNRWAEVFPEATLDGRCLDPERASLGRRASAFGHAWRDSVQAARTQLDRLERVSRAPTVDALLTDAERHAALGLRARADEQARWYLEAAAWHLRFVEPALVGCPRELAAAPGLPGLRDDAGAGAAARVAVIGVGGGLICPGWLPADGRVVMLRERQACYGDADCSCAPERVLPGAVLAP